MTNFGWNCCHSHQGLCPCPLSSCHNGARYLMICNINRSFLLHPFRRCRGTETLKILSSGCREMINESRSQTPFFFLEGLSNLANNLFHPGPDPHNKKCCLHYLLFMCRYQMRQVQGRRETKRMTILLP